MDIAVSQRFSIPLDSISSSPNERFLFWKSPFFGFFPKKGEGNNFDNFPGSNLKLYKSRYNLRIDVFSLDSITSFPLPLLTYGVKTLRRIQSINNKIPVLIFHAKSSARIFRLLTSVFVNRFDCPVWIFTALKRKKASFVLRHV